MARLIAGLYRPDAGIIRVQGQDVITRSKSEVARKARVQVADVPWDRQDDAALATLLDALKSQQPDAEFSFVEQDNTLGA